MNYLVRDRDVIFNLAGQVSHIDSMRDPYTDLEINCRSQLTMLEACRNHNPGVKVVFAGTRQVYGRPDSLPVDETHLVRPTDVNGINKAAGEYYHLVYNNVFGVRACSLRLTNVYGPRQLIKHNRQGFIGWFIRLAIEDRTIQIYGDGSQLRDFVYVDDAADAFLRAGADDACNGEVFNVGGDGAAQPSRADGAARRRRRHRDGSRTSSGRRRRRRSTSAASTPTRRSSRARPGGRRRSRCATGLAADGRVLPRALRSLLDPDQDRSRTLAGARVTPSAHPVRVADARARTRRACRAAIDRVIASGWFVLGPEVEAFEAEFAAALRRGARRRRRQRAPTRSR